MTAERGRSRGLLWVIAVLLAITIVLLVVLIVRVGQRPAQPASTQGRQPGLGEAETASPSPPGDSVGSEEATQDGLYVKGVRLSGGVSQSKVMKVFGTEDERFGEPGQVYYGWNLPDGSYLSLQFDQVGSLQSASLSTRQARVLDPSTYAALGGRRILPAKDTLGDVIGWFPDGTIAEPLSGEGVNILRYKVVYGGEGSEEMTFGVSWERYGAAKSAAQRNSLKLTSIAVGFPQN